MSKSTSKCVGVNKEVIEILRDRGYARGREETLVRTLTEEGFIICDRDEVPVPRDVDKYIKEYECGGFSSEGRIDYIYFIKEYNEGRNK